MKNSDNFCDISIRISKRSILRLCIVSVIDFFSRKLSIYLITHIKILRFLRLWISLEYDIVEKTAATFMLKNVVTLSILWFYTVYICSVSSFSAVFMNLSRRLLICDSRRSSWCFVKYSIFATVIDFSIFLSVFNKAMSWWIFVVSYVSYETLENNMHE